MCCTSLQGRVAIIVDKIRAGSFLGFVPDQLEKVHALRVPGISGAVFVPVPGACMRFAPRAGCLR